MGLLSFLQVKRSREEQEGSRVTTLQILVDREYGANAELYHIAFITGILLVCIIALLINRANLRIPSSAAPENAIR